jgi:hypothetical protein
LAAEPVGPGLQAVSVNICCPSSYGGAGEAEGSGTLVVGKVGDKPAVWVLTAHHVVKDLRSEKEVVSPGGEKKTHVSYRDAQVIQERVVDGRAVGETMIVVMATGNTAIMDASGQLLLGEFGIGNGKFPVADHWDIFNGMRTLSANIAVELPEAAVHSTHYRTLFLGAMVLFILTFALNTVAEVLRQRLREKFRIG